MKGLETNVMVQVAVAVEDIEAVAKKIADIFNMEVPEIYDLHESEEYGNYYKGNPTKAYCKLCYFHMGQLDLELLQPVGEPSNVRDFINENGGNGVQHISFNVKNIDDKVKYLESKGLELVSNGFFPGGKCAFLKFPEIGTEIELLEGSSSVKLD